MEQETFWTLLRDPAHWEFELFLILVFDVLIGTLIWPYLKRWFKHHKSDDAQLQDLLERVEKLEKSK